MPNIYSDPISKLPNVDELFTRIGWQIDHLMAIDTRGKGIVPALYQAAVEVIHVVAPGDVVGIITGFPSRSFLGRGITETDGPVGALYLARVLEEVLNAVPVIIIDPALQKYCANAGLLVTTNECLIQPALWGYASIPGMGENDSVNRQFSRPFPECQAHRVPGDANTQFCLSLNVFQALSIH